MLNELRGLQSFLADRKHFLPPVVPTQTVTPKFLSLRLITLPSPPPFLYNLTKSNWFRECRTLRAAENRCCFFSFIPSAAFNNVN